MIFEFGTKLDGVNYRDRPGAYVVLTNDQMQVAVIRTSHGHFLPGGGIDAGETPIEALKREILEEIGWHVSALNEIGEAVEYIKARTDGEYYRIQSTFFGAQRGVSVGDGVEEDHQLIWLSQEEAAKFLTRQSQVWALKRVEIDR